MSAPTPTSQFSTIIMNYQQLTENNYNMNNPDKSYHKHVADMRNSIKELRDDLHNRPRPHPDADFNVHGDWYHKYAAEYKALNYLESIYRPRYADIYDPGNDYKFANGIPAPSGPPPSVNVLPAPVNNSDSLPDIASLSIN